MCVLYISCAYRVFTIPLSLEKVWKVARYTTAAPMFFKECDDYVDGGVLANNPSETGLTAVQEHFHSRGLPLTIAIVVRFEIQVIFAT